MQPSFIFLQPSAIIFCNHPPFFATIRLPLWIFLPRHLMEAANASCFASLFFVLVTVLSWGRCGCFLCLLAGSSAPSPVFFLHALRTQVRYRSQPQGPCARKVLPKEFWLQKSSAPHAFASFCNKTFSFGHEGFARQCFFFPRSFLAAGRVSRVHNDKQAKSIQEIL